MDPVEVEVKRICDSAADEKDVALAAMQNEIHATMANEAGNFDDAVRLGRTATSLWKKLSESTSASDSQREISKLSGLRTEACLGSSQWKSGDFESARNTFELARKSLAEMQQEMEAPRKPSGLFSFFKSAKPDFELLRQWTQIYAAVDMNNGVMLSARNKFDDAIQSYGLAEQTLFDGYIKHIGPDEDLESTGKVINLWENIMTAALAANRNGRAAEAAANIMKLISYWPSHGHSIPEEVANATGTFLGTVNSLPLESRNRLDEALPEGLADSIDSLIL